MKPYPAGVRSSRRTIDPVSHAIALLALSCIILTLPPAALGADSLPKLERALSAALRSEDPAGAASSDPSSGIPASGRESRGSSVSSTT